MSGILNDGADPVSAAERWLQANPEVLDVWLDGVTTKDGGDAVAAVREALAL
jgi:glycine betaine/proline transport system substrate-binding protein